MRRTWITALTVAAVAAGGLTLASPARADDGRAVSPSGELRALYRHGLNRAPDASGTNTYLAAAERDCKAGVLRMSYDLLTSPEAARFLRTPDRQTNAVFMSLLNRAPDRGGWNTYLAMNRAEGIDRSTVDIMQSAEYRSRVRAICANRTSPSSVGVFNGDEVALIVQKLLRAAAIGSVNCGISTVVKKMKKHKGRAGLASIAAYSAEISAQGAGTDAGCQLAKQLALGAAWAASIGSRNHPVYVYELATRDKPGTISQTMRYTYMIGRTPADTRTFTGSVKVARS